MHAGAAGDKTRQALMLHRGSVGRREKRTAGLPRERGPLEQISAFGGFP